MVAQAFPSGGAEHTFVRLYEFVSHHITNPAPIHFRYRWSDHLKSVALAFQEEHQMFLASPECAPMDHDCMANILEMEAEKGGAGARARAGAGTHPPCQI